MGINVTDSQKSRKYKRIEKTKEKLSEFNKSLTLNYFQEQIVYAMEDFKVKSGDVVGIETDESFPDKYYLTMKDDLPPLITLKTTNGDPTVVRISEDDEIYRSIDSYVRQIRPLWPELYDGAWTPTNSENTARRWKHYSPHITYPKPFKWPKDRDIAFHQFDFIPEKINWDGLFPNEAFNPNEHGNEKELDFIGSGYAFMEILSRINNWVGFCAFIGSIFDTESIQQQALVLIGEGGEGKSAVLRFLKKIFNRTMIFGNEQVFDGDHGTTIFLGKRVAAFADVNNSKIFSCATFKSLTGGDDILVNPKGLSLFSSNLNIKVIISTNKLPSISSMKCDKRRMIPIEFSPITGDEIPQRIYDEKLYSERAKFISFCMWVYDKVCKNGKAVPVDGLVDRIAEENEMSLDFIFNELFEYNPKIKKSECVTRNELIRLLSNMQIKKKNEIDKFTSYMRTRFKIKSDRYGKYEKTSYYPGLKKRPAKDCIVVSNVILED